MAFGGGGALRIEDRGRVEGWDEHTVYEQVIRNYTGKSIDVQIRRHFGGDFTLTSELGASNYDYLTAQYAVKVDPGQTAWLRYQVTQRQGTNVKHSRVDIKTGKPAGVAWAD